MRHDPIFGQDGFEVQMSSIVEDLYLGEALEYLQ